MSLQNKKYLLVIAGPTAVGKTGLAMALAKHYRTEILSTDSRQFYREMDLGTAKPSRQERSEVRHHLVDFLSVQQPYDVRQFEADALHTLQQVWTKADIGIATGGSGLYIKTLCEGLDEIPEVSPEIRQKWEARWQKEGLEPLALLLQKTDPVYYAHADTQNPRRVLRALEIYDATGVPFSAFRKRQQTYHAPVRDFHAIKIGLSRERDELYDRINRRVDLMIAHGLIEEARSLYPYRHLNALQTVGYQELFPYFEQQYDVEEAVRLIKRNSRRYAKRQLTWFRKDQQMHWFDLHDNNEDQLLPHIIAYIDETIHHLKHFA